MKKLTCPVLITTLIVSLYSCTSSRMPVADTQPAPTVTYQAFYDDLSPYGQWVDYPGYGYVWSPSISGFQPYYTNGYWVSTDQGWNWCSGYDWGWAPFHYGRWFYETGYGWLWLPGYEWAPAWVMWRNNADFYGWAPLAPGMSFGMAANVNIPFEHWSFVDHRYLTDHNLGNHTVDINRKEQIYNSTTIINNINYTKNRTAYASGPRVSEVQRYSGQKITPLIVRQHDHPAASAINSDKKEIRMFRPEIKEHDPAKIEKPREAIPYKDLPHNNMQRGTWAMPAQHPQRMQGNRGR